MNHDLPTKFRGIWSSLIWSYHVAEANYDLALAQDREADALHDARTKALDTILLMPAEHISDLRFKIDLMSREDLGDGWWCAQEAIALLAIEANRLLPFAREGGVALAASI